MYSYLCMFFGWYKASLRVGRTSVYKELALRLSRRRVGRDTVGLGQAFGWSVQSTNW